MRDFIRRHILFPKEWGSYPYVWLLFLVPLAINLVWPLQSINWLWLGLLLIFMYSYRQLWGSDQPLKVISWIGCQLLIAAIFLFGRGESAPLLFMAWQISMSRMSRKVFLTSVFGYYLVILAVFGTRVYQLSLPTMLEWEQLGEILVLVGMLPFAYIFSQAIKSAELSFLNKQLAVQNRRLESVIKEEERSRIASDLHDDLGQAFSIITMKAELAERLIERDAAQASQEIQEIAQTSRNNLKAVRHIVRDLKEPTILKTIVEITDYLQQANIQLIVIGEEAASHWPKAVQQTMSYIIKEATTNTIRHAKATKVTIHFEGEYNLCIQDNGVGNHSDSGGFGISGMIRRVEQMGGNCNIQDIDGTTIEVSLPKEDNND